MRFQATDDTDHVEISGVNYVVDDKGGFNCENTEHQPLLRQLGFRSENDPAPVVAPVKADTPPAIPEGYVSEEAVRALVEENEDMKQGVLKLQADLDAANKEKDALNGALTSAKTVEDGLRDRIQELEGQLAAAKTPAEATETATETQTDTSGASGTGDGAAATETATETAGAAPAKKGK